MSSEMEVDTEPDLIDLGGDVIQEGVYVDADQHPAESDGYLSSTKPSSLTLLESLVPEELLVYEVLAIEFGSGLAGGILHDISALAS